MKFTEDQRQEVRTWILELHLVGIRKTKEIRKILAEQRHFPISERQIRRYRDDVRREVIASSKFDRDEQVGLSIARLESLYRKCVNGEDYRGALAAQRELDELLGLKVLHIEHSAKVPFANWLQGLKPPEPEPKNNGKKTAANGASGGESG